MSDDSVDFFDGLDEFNNFEFALGGLVERIDFVEQMTNNAILHESKLFLSVSSIEGLPHKKGFMKKASVQYSLQVELGLDKHKRKLFAGPAVGVLSTKDENPLVFDIVDFYATAQMKLTLKRKNVMTGHKKIIGEHSIRLMDLVSFQSAHDEKRTKMTVKDYLASGSCYASNHVVMETTLHSEEEVSSEPYPSVAVNWLETAKSSRDEAARGFKHSILRGYQEAVVVVPRAKVKVNFKFRLLPLQKCLQLNTSLKSSHSVSSNSTNNNNITNRNSGINSISSGVPHTSGSTTASRMSAAVSGAAKLSSGVGGEVHSISDFHCFVALARPAEVIEVMKGLAARQVLAQALRRQSSEGLTPLDTVLLAGNSEVATVILQRAGNLCFRGMLPHHRGPFHYAVEGGSKTCVDILVRFFSKYSSREPMGLNAHQAHWSPLLSELIDWRDEHSESPLLLACRLNRSHLVSSLLLAGAEIAAVNRQTGYTPLMCAAAVGATEVIGLLLSILRSDAELEDNLHAVSIPGSSSTADSALARHLRSNHRSRNLLRMANPSAGGYFNTLALFNCDPAHTEEGHGMQAIHIAAVHGHVEVVRQLLMIGVSAGVTDRHGNNIFHLLALSASQPHTHHNHDVSAQQQQSASYARKSVCDITSLIAYEARQFAAHQALLSGATSGNSDAATAAAAAVLMHNRPRALCVVNFRGKTAIDVSVECGQYDLTKRLLRGLLLAYPDLVSHIKVLVDMAVLVVDDVSALSNGVTVAASASAATPTTASGGIDCQEQIRSANRCSKVASVEFLLTANRANSLDLKKSSHNASFITETSSMRSGVTTGTTSGANANTNSGYKYACVALDDSKVNDEDGHVVEEKSDDEPKGTVNSASTSSITTSAPKTAVLKTSSNGYDSVEDLLKQLESELKHLQSILLQIYSAIAAATTQKSRTSFAGTPTVKKVDSRDSNDDHSVVLPFDDEADDLAYDFALSALTKKALGGDTVASS